MTANTSNESQSRFYAKLTSKYPYRLPCLLPDFQLLAGRLSHLYFHNPELEPLFSVL